MGVRVDHAGHEDPRSKVDRGDEHVPTGGCGRPDRCDAARGVDVDESVGFVLEPTRRQRGQQPRPKRERWTFRKLASRHDGRLARPRRRDQPVAEGSLRRQVAGLPGRVNEGGLQ